MDFHRVLPVLFSLLVLPASAGAQAFTEAELRSLYYADLGPDAVDVAGYPKDQQENYRILRQICARCHTPARALNSPRASRKSWEIYIFEMRLRSVVSRKHRYTIPEGQAALEFLVYDSQQRKGRLAFEEKSAQLQTRFAQSIAERMRRLQESNAKVRP